MISKHTNYKYDSTIPYFTGDRRYGQDMVRDFYSILSHIGEGLRGVTGQDNYLLKGGVVTEGSTKALVNISELTGTVLSTVEIPDSFASIPPTKTTKDIIIPIYLGGQTDVSLSGATLDGTTINYVKASYTVTDGNTRARAKKAGTYAYEVQPSVTITITSVAPTAYELELATLVGNGTSTLVISPTKYGYLSKIDAVKLNAQNKTGILIPLYVYPSSVFTNTTYNAVIDFAKENRDIPMIVIINPSSGAGTVTDGNYTYAIRRLQGANIKVTGYVSTNYAGTAIATVKADVDKWSQLYPDIDGIFFDEMTFADVDADVAYYKELNEYVKMNGMEITITNPGAPFAGAYHEANVADVIISWENSTYPTLAQAKEDYAGGAVDYPLNRRGVLIHSELTYVPTEALQLAKYYGWIYITDDLLSPNPWDALSAYLTEMAETINTVNGTLVVSDVIADSINVGDIAWKIKKFTGTTDAISGDAVITHGIDHTKILNIRAYYEQTAGTWSLMRQSGSEDNFINSTTFTILSDTVSVPYRCYIMYET